MLLNRHMKRWAKVLLGRIIYASKVHKLLLANAAMIVAFHRVNNMTVGDGLTCGVEAFRHYCEFFRRHFEVVSLRHLVDKMEAGLPLNRELAITFDDGYADNYENAAPILKALGLPATFFVVTRFISTDTVPWWDKEAPQAWMSWEQVRALHSEGFDIGSHTCTHVNLAEVSGDTARKETLHSRLQLEERLGTKIDLFVYPYGGKDNINDETRMIIEAAGFRCSASCCGGINRTGVDPFQLKRIPIASGYESSLEFAFDTALGRA
jgi:peptidoglycan/xylan/chitin deacetylase (PgdA/CDA1 family)